uniref:Beta-glucosidase Bgl3C n=1 Tax=uncultured bacterium Contig15 TaxID=1393441 RepID=W0FLM4_9BACT|nr:beta-glucosidase Bgl3C [uncultured bacterium Contig15]
MTEPDRLPVLIAEIQEDSFMERWIRARFLPGLPLGRDGRRVTAGKEHIALSRRAAREGMVLLKNEGNVLPLQPGCRVALFGKGTIDYVKGGGGSGDVTVPYIRNLYDGFAELIGADSVFPDSVRFYQEYVSARYAEGWVPGMVAEPPVPEDLLRKARAFTDTAVISISRFSGEGWDRKSPRAVITRKEPVTGDTVSMSDVLFEKGDFYLSEAERRMVQAVSETFDQTVVVLNTGAMMETACFRDNPRIQGLLLAYQGGMEGACAAAELLLGLASPCGKLTDTYAENLEDYPGCADFYESDDYVNYTEDIFVGYRYFETIPAAAEKVVYPFGFGLSYTRFSLSGEKLVIRGEEAEAGVLVTNEGDFPGREVVQIYYAAPRGRLSKPARELAGYRKTRLLQPGETEWVTVRFPLSCMASYDDLGKITRSAWVLEAGEYRFFIGTSIRDVKQIPETWSLSDNWITEQLTSRLAPSCLEKRLLEDGTFEPLPVSPCNDFNATVLDPLSHDEIHATPEVRAVPRIGNFGRETRMKLQDVADGKMALKEFVAALPVEDLACLLGGQPNTGLANTFGYGNNPLYGIPNIMTADGPAGIRFHPGLGVTTTAFPCATLLGSTWDPEIVREVGAAAALEAKENNIMVWLAPGVNIHRNPLCGRNFEYFSEDPLLAGKQAAALIRGVQSRHIAATPKHFALNNKETNRRNCDSRASERAIREIYLRQFEILVKEARPWSIMTSYNIINGHRASECKDLLTGILREEWGFDGMVTTDWWTFGEHYKEVAAGNDMKMATGFPDRLLDALEKGALTREEMEKAAENVLRLILRID